MNMFRMGEGPKLQSEQSQAERQTIEGRIARALAKIHEPIDIDASLHDVEARIVRATNDQDRDQLNIERAALMQYRKATALPLSLSSPLLSNLETIPRLDPVEEIKRPVPGEKLPTPKLVRPKPVAGEGEVRGPVTVVRPRKPQQEVVKPSE